MSTESASPASKTHRLNVRIDPQLMAKALKLAEARSTTVSTMVRNYLVSLVNDTTPPTPCTSCGMSIEDCDNRIIQRRPACCSTCSFTDTHNDTPSTFTQRMAAR